MTIENAARQILSDLECWRSTGDPRPASWADRRIAILRAALDQIPRPGAQAPDEILIPARPGHKIVQCWDGGLAYDDDPRAIRGWGHGDPDAEDGTDGPDSSCARGSDSV